MAGTIAPKTLQALLEGRAPFALIDVREAGEYNSSHIAGASVIARRQLEFSMPHAVPFPGTPSSCATTMAGVRGLPRPRWSAWATATCRCSTAASIAG